MPTSKNDDFGACMASIQHPTPLSHDEIVALCKAIMALAGCVDALEDGPVVPQQTEQAVPPPDAAN